MIVAATGHRPERLGGYGPEAFARLVQIAAEYLADVCPEMVISGMALGWDMAVAVAALSSGFKLTAALPCDGQDAVWPDEPREMHRQLIAAAAKVETVSPGPYEPRKMFVRNNWMVDRCDLLIAMWDGGNGGTAGCVSYAIKTGRPWVNLWHRYSGE